MKKAILPLKELIHLLIRTNFNLAISRGLQKTILDKSGSSCACLDPTNQNYVHMSKQKMKDLDAFLSIVNNSVSKAPFSFLLPFHDY